MPIAREGWPVIGTVTAVFGVVAVVGVLAGHPSATVPLVLGLAFSLNFFRDPERIPPPEDRLVVSPADGRVLEVVSMREEQFLGAPTTRISIFMSPLDVHVNRSPVAGTVTLVKHTPGMFRAAFDSKAALDNERNAIVVDGGGRRYLMVQIAGAVARRIRCHVQPGSRVERGGRVGMIMFGSRCDLYLPPEVRPTVARGDRVRAGASVVGEVPA